MSILEITEGLSSRISYEVDNGENPLFLFIMVAAISLIFCLTTSLAVTYCFKDKKVGSGERTHRKKAIRRKIKFKLRRFPRKITTKPSNIESAEDHSKESFNETLTLLEPSYVPENPEPFSFLPTSFRLTAGSDQNENKLGAKVKAKTKSEKIHFNVGNFFKFKNNRNIVLNLFDSKRLKKLKKKILKAIHFPRHNDVLSRSEISASFRSGNVRQKLFRRLRQRMLRNSFHSYSTALNRLKGLVESSTSLSSDDEEIFTAHPNKLNGREEESDYQLERKIECFATSFIEENKDFQMNRKLVLNRKDFILSMCQYLNLFITNGFYIKPFSLCKELIIMHQMARDHRFKLRKMNLEEDLHDLILSVSTDPMFCLCRHLSSLNNQKKKFYQMPLKTHLFKFLPEPEKPTEKLFEKPSLSTQRVNENSQNVKPSTTLAKCQSKRSLKKFYILQREFSQQFQSALMGLHSFINIYIIYQNPNTVVFQFHAKPEIFFINLSNLRMVKESNENDTTSWWINDPQYIELFKGIKTLAETLIYFTSLDKRTLQNFYDIFIDNNSSNDIVASRTLLNDISAEINTLDCVQPKEIIDNWNDQEEHGKRCCSNDLDENVSIDLSENESSSVYEATLNNFYDFFIDKAFAYNENASKSIIYDTLPESNTSDLIQSQEAFTNYNEKKEKDEEDEEDEVEKVFDVDEVDEVKEVDEVEEVDEVDEEEEVDEVDEVDEEEEVDDVEEEVDVAEVDEVDEVDKAEEDEVDKAEELEEIDEVDDVDNVEEVDCKICYSNDLVENAFAQLNPNEPSTFEASLDESIKQEPSPLEEDFAGPHSVEIKSSTNFNATDDSPSPYDIDKESFGSGSEMQTESIPQIYAEGLFSQCNYPLKSKNFCPNSGKKLKSSSHSSTFGKIWQGYEKNLVKWEMMNNNFPGALKPAIKHCMENIRKEDRLDNNKKERTPIAKAKLLDNSSLRDSWHTQSCMALSDTPSITESHSSRKMNPINESTAFSLATENYFFSANDLLKRRATKITDSISNTTSHTEKVKNPAKTLNLEEFLHSLRMKKNLSSHCKNHTRPIKRLKQSKACLDLRQSYFVQEPSLILRSPDIEDGLVTESTPKIKRLGDDTLTKRNFTKTERFSQSSGKNLPELKFTRSLHSQSKCSSDKSVSKTSSDISISLANFLAEKNVDESQSSDKKSSQKSNRFMKQKPFESSTSTIFKKVDKFTKLYKKSSDAVNIQKKPSKTLNCKVEKNARKNIFLNTNRGKGYVPNFTINNEKIKKRVLSSTNDDGPKVTRNFSSRVYQSTIASSLKAVPKSKANLQEANQQGKPVKKDPSVAGPLKMHNPQKSFAKSTLQVKKHPPNSLKLFDVIVGKGTSARNGQTKGISHTKS